MLLEVELLGSGAGEDSLRRDDVAVAVSGASRTRMLLRVGMEVDLEELLGIDV